MFFGRVCKVYLKNEFLCDRAKSVSFLGESGLLWQILNHFSGFFNVICRVSQQVMHRCNEIFGWASSKGQLEVYVCYCIFLRIDFGIYIGLYLLSCILFNHHCRMHLNKYV